MKHKPRGGGGVGGGGQFRGAVSTYDKRERVQKQLALRARKASKYRRTLRRLEAEGRLAAPALPRDADEPSDGGGGGGGGGSPDPGSSGSGSEGEAAAGAPRLPPPPAGEAFPAPPAKVRWRRDARNGLSRRRSRFPAAASHGPAAHAPASLLVRGSMD
jgi:hypothetical protein